MTGTIKSVGFETGVIQGENTQDVSFDLSAVLTYDLSELAAGQPVTFDLKRGTHPKAINILVQKQTYVSTAAKCLRYVGFEQSGGNRIYNFEQFVPGEGTITFMVTADMALFTRHRVGFQDGPALCLRSVTDRMDSAGAMERPALQHSLSDQNMLAHVARQKASQRSSRPKRKLELSDDKLPHSGPA